MKKINERGKETDLSFVNSDCSTHAAGLTTHFVAFAVNLDSTSVVV